MAKILPAKYEDFSVSLSPEELSAVYMSAQHHHKTPAQRLAEIIEHALHVQAKVNQLEAERQMSG